MGRRFSLTAALCFAVVVSATAWTSGKAQSPDEHKPDAQELVLLCQTALEDNAANTRKIAEAEDDYKATAAGTDSLPTLCAKAHTFLQFVENRLKTLATVEKYCGQTPKATPQAMQALKNSMQEATDGLAQAKTWYEEKC